MTAVKVKDPLLVFGVGADYSERGRANQTVVAADAFYSDPSGLSLYGAFVDRYTNHNFGFAGQTGTGASFGTPDPAVAGTDAGCRKSSMSRYHACANATAVASTHRIASIQPKAPAPASP